MTLEGAWRDPFGEIARRLRRRRRPHRGGMGGRSGDTLAGLDPGPDAAADARFGGDDREGPWVTVHRAGTIPEAHIVRGALEASDIPVLLRDRSLSSLTGGALHGGIDVQVPRGLVERAEEVLAGEDGPEGEPWSDDAPGK